MKKWAKKRQFSRAWRHLAVICVTEAFLIMELAGCGRTSGAMEIGAQTVADGTTEAAGAQTAAAEELQPLPAQTQAATEEEKLFVHVCGQVLRPGVYELPAGSRVWDAVEAAGGFLEEAARDSINLASELEDGAKVVIPSREEASEDPYGLLEDGWYQEAQAAESEKDGQPGLVDINRATVAELQTVPGIGEVRAQDIVAYREAYGPFANVEDIMQVSGIKEGLFAKIKDYITVGG